MTKAKYLGEIQIDVSKNAVFNKRKKEDWALAWITMYGGFDGEHHKAWLLDQVARILHGSEITVKKATWSDATVEYRYSLGKPTKSYHQWVKNIRGKRNKDGEYEHSYDVGVPP